VCGDLTSAFDFAAPDAALPALPNAKGASAVLLEHIQRPKAHPPAAPEPLWQEPGARPSRALPYELHVDAAHDPAKGSITLAFRNTGRMGAVFHVYDHTNLAAIPRRYTVEAGKSLRGVWNAGAGYDLWVLGPNGFLRTFKGANAPGPEIAVSYDRGALAVAVSNHTTAAQSLTLAANAYLPSTPKPLPLRPGGTARERWDLKDSGYWYDFTVAGDGFARRFAGRVETGAHGASDPALGTQS
jgi:phospholipase C